MIYENGGTAIVGPDGSIFTEGAVVTSVEAIPTPSIRWLPLGEKAEGTYFEGSLPALPEGMTKWVVTRYNTVTGQRRQHELPPGDFSIPVSNGNGENVRIWVGCRNTEGQGFLAVPEVIIPHVAPPVVVPPPAGPYAITAAEWDARVLAVENYFSPFHSGLFGFEVLIHPTSEAYGTGSGEAHVPKIKHMEWHDLGSAPTLPRTPALYAGLDPDTNSERFILYSFRDEHAHHVKAPGVSLNQLSIKFAYEVPEGALPYRDPTNTNKADYTAKTGPWSATKKGPLLIPAEWANGLPVAGAPGQVVNWTLAPGNAAGRFVATITTPPSAGDHATLTYQYDVNLDGNFTTFASGTQTQLAVGYNGQVVDVRVRAVNGNGKEGEASASKSVSIPGVANPDPVGGPTPTTGKSSITLRSGHTITFNKSMQCGQYADGSWFIYNPSNSGGFAITGRTPTSSQVGTRWINGVMKNPTKPRNGLDSQNPGGNDFPPYNHTYNVAPSIKGNISFAANEQGSLVLGTSALSDPSPYPAGEGRPNHWGSPIERLDILIVTNEIPPVLSIRPAANSKVANKKPTVTMNDIDWNKIPLLNVGRKPSQDLSWATLPNIITQFTGQGSENGNAFPSSWMEGDIDSHQIAGRTNSYGTLSWYGAYWALGFAPACYYLFDPSVSREDKEKILMGMLQIGSDFHQQFINGGSTNVFHGLTWRLHHAVMALIMKDGTARDAVISSFNSWRPSTVGYAYRYIDTPLLDDLSFGGEDPRNRRQGLANGSAGPYWPWDEPYKADQLGFAQYRSDYVTTSNASWGSGLWTNKGALSGVEASQAIWLGQFEGFNDFIHNVEIHWCDRTMRIWKGHIEGTYTVTTSDSANNFRQPSVHFMRRYMYEFYNTFRSRVPVSVHTTGPERPPSPRVTRVNSTTAQVKVRTQRIPGGAPIQKGQYRWRANNTNNDSDAGWSTPADFVIPTPNEFTFNISGLPSGAIIQVQIRFVGTDGKLGVWSGNWPYRADATALPAIDVPAGNQAQVDL